MTASVATPSWYRRAGHGSLAENFSGRDNSIGLIRLVLALAVVVSHANPVGFGTGDPGAANQGVSVGGMAVDGFFVLSGFLIVRSALRLHIGRYLWARALRILPGLWLCLVFTALVVAPLLALHLHGGRLPGGFWHGPGGPFRYIRENMWTGLRQLDISDTLTRAEAAGTAHNPAFDGALWTLAYEATCYLVVAAFAVAAVLRKVPALVAVLAAGLWGSILWDLWSSPRGRYAVEPLDGHYLNLPLLGHHMGSLAVSYLVYLGFPFAIGALFQLYIKRLPINDVLGVGGFAVFALSLEFGGYYAFGVPALAYGLIWFAVRSPKPLRKVGRKRDLSYGVYIYGFVVEQVLVVYGVAAKGYWVYLPAALAGSALLALISWYAIEKPALMLKDWTPRIPRRKRTPPEEQEPSGPPHTEVAAASAS